MKGRFAKSGIILTTATKDGNNQVLVVALALVPTKDYENWKWFLNQLKCSPLQIPKKYAFIPDRQKGSYAIIYIG